MRFPDPSAADSRTAARYIDMAEGLDVTGNPSGVCQAPQSRSVITSHRYESALGWLGGEGALVSDEGPEQVQAASGEGEHGLRGGPISRSRLLSAREGSASAASTVAEQASDAQIDDDPTAAEAGIGQMSPVAAADSPSQPTAVGTGHGRAVTGPSDDQYLSSSTRT